MYSFQGSIAGLPVRIVYNGVTSRFRETLRAFEDTDENKPALCMEYEFCEFPIQFLNQSAGINNMRFRLDTATGCPACGKTNTRFC